MIEIDAGIFTILDADRLNNAAGHLGALGVTAVYANGDVEEAAQTPYIRFGPLAEPASNMMGSGPIEYECVYSVLVVDDTNAGNGKTRATAIANRVKVLLHKQPMSTAAPVRHIRTLLDRKLDIPDRLEGRMNEQVGANYRIWTEET